MDKCPISGLPCQYNKIVHITEINQDGTCVTNNLCQFCLLNQIPKNEKGDLITDLAKPIDEEVQYLDENKVLIVDNPADLFKIMLNPDKLFKQNISDSKNKCPKCDMTEKEFNKIGKMGCEFCYVHFAKEIYPLIQTFHKSIDHVGKRPKSYKDALNKESLEKRLSQAIALENYEEASEIKKRLNDLNDS